MKTVYQTDAAGYVVGATEADESPLEPGIFLVPAGCVEEVPPSVADGQRARWDGTGWLVEGPLDPEPDPEPTLAERRDAILAAVTALRNQRLAEGAPHGGKRFALDDTSRTDLGGMATTATLVLLGALTWPDDYATGWIALDNTRLPLPTPTEGIALAAAVAARYAAIVQRARDIKDAVLASDEPEATDITVGWPA